MTIKELRTITGLSQRAFGKKYHIPTRTIEDWEGGRRRPSETILYLLERAVKEDYMPHFNDREKEAVEKLYDYIDIDKESIENDWIHDYLTQNIGRDGKEYFWYSDEVANAAISIDTLEIFTEEDFFVEQFY